MIMSLIAVISVGTSWAQEGEVLTEPVPETVDESVADPIYTALPPARNLTNRISLGYNNQLNFGALGVENRSMTDYFFDVNSLSVKYWITDRIGIEGMLGYFTAELEEYGGWALDLAAKFHYNLIMEDYMSLYTGAGLGIVPHYINYGKNEDANCGVQVMGYAGIEFFIQELPNLGFDIEVGLRYIWMGRYQEFSTYGGTGTFGIRYYF